jgi:hypothetical protein
MEVIVVSMDESDWGCTGYGGNIRLEWAPRYGIRWRGSQVCVIINQVVPTLTASNYLDPDNNSNCTPAGGSHNGNAIRVVLTVQWEPTFFSLGIGGASV